ncbi:MAG: RNA polymerase sigma factor [Phycisphaerales bacterium]|nr:RNA polymerase sigma factor [Phycisphaerales bacterium]
MTAIGCSAESRSAQCVGQLAQRHYDIVVRYVCRWGSRDLAEDVAQEVFLRLMALPGVADRELSAGYLIAVARNILRRQAHKNKRAAEALAALRAAKGQGEEADEAEGAAPGARVEPKSLQAALGELSDKHRDAVQLLVCRGLSYRAAAAAMNVGLNTVHTWELRGIDRMRRRLRGAEPARAA